MKSPIIPPEVAVRAARLSRLPAMTIAKAAARFGVSRGAVERARRERPDETRLSLDDYLLATLSDDGLAETGTIGDLASLAGYIDYINHDGCNADDIQRMLDALVSDGKISIKDKTWRLLVPWP